MKHNQTLRRGLSVLLALLMCLSLLPTTVLAEEGTTTADKTADFTAAGTSEALELLGGADKAAWDAEKSTLTLKGVDFTTTASTAVKLPDGATIELADGTTNTITSVSEGTSESCGIYANNGLTIQGGGTLTVTGGEATGDGYCESRGIFANDGGITISGGTVTAMGGKAANSSGGIYAVGGGITISGGTVTATGGKAKNSLGIYAGAGVVISGGTVIAAGGEGENNSHGIYTSYVAISGGTVTATGGETEDNSDGIYAYNGVTISGGTVEATGGTAGEYSYGINATIGGVTISGGHVTAKTLAEESDTITRMALNKAPDLDEYTGYQWRTGEKDPFTSSTTTAYPYSADHTYVEFSNGNTVTTCTVSFDANGGSGTMTDVTGVSGSYTLPECGFTAPEGKQFAGWATSAGGEVIFGTTYDVTADITLYAIWEDIPVTEYDITVTDGKATVGAGIEISKAAEGTTVTLTANAPASGKVFDKWVVESGSITLADANSETITFTMPAGAVSVKATYKDAPHTHTFDQEIVKPEALKTAADCTHDAVYFKSCACGEAISTDDADTFTATGTALGHEWATDWSKDADKHWNECSCGAKSEEAAHSFKWVVDKEATATQKGSRHEECEVCGYQRPAVEIPATGSTTEPTDPTESNPNTGALDDVPQTGDNSNMILWIVLLLVSGLGVTGTVVYSKRKKHV